MVPIGHKFEKEGLCGSSGVVQVIIN